MQNVTDDDDDRQTDDSLCHQRDR